MKKKIIITENQLHKAILDSISFLKESTTHNEIMTYEEAKKIAVERLTINDVIDSVYFGNAVECPRDLPDEFAEVMIRKPNEDIELRELIFNKIKELFTNTNVKQYGQVRY